MKAIEHVYQRFARLKALNALPLGTEMLSLLYPDLFPALVAFPGGLQVIQIPGEERLKLIIKAPKEPLLTAKLNRGLKIYVLPAKFEGAETYALISAFHDNPENPYTLSTPLCDDPLCARLLEALLSNRLDVHLFDDLGREMLGYKGTVNMPETTRQKLSGMKLIPLPLSGLLDVVRQAEVAFSLRGTDEEDTAISISFDEALFPEDIFFQNLRPEHHAYHGSRGYSYTTLNREIPGIQQEQDIIRLLERTFHSEQIYHGPLRTDNRKEAMDILVVGDEYLLIVQAKDSPNTERSIRNSLDRKRLTARKSLEKALDQVKGAVRYVRSRDRLHLLVKDKEVIIEIEHLKVRALVILKEMFDDEYEEYSPLILQTAEEIQAPCISLDYRELVNYTSFLYGEEAFFGAYHRVFDFGSKHGTLPRLRVRPPEPH